MNHLPSFHRPHVRRLVELLTEDGHMRLVAVTGPRQAGKTTMVLQALEELETIGIPSWYVAIDDPTPDSPPFHVDLGGVETLIPGHPPNPEWLISTWERARAAAERSGRGLVMVLDEIQRIRDWSVIAKGLWDRDRRTGCPLRVVILGSAPWAMLTGVHESLAGRFDAFPVTHWSLGEMQRAFRVTLDEYVFFGGYPGAAIHIGDAPRWRGHIRHAIVAPIVDRDILSLTRVGKPSLMRALMDLAPEYSGQIISYRKLQGQLDDAGNTTTLARYLDLLADAGLVAGLEKHSAKPYLSKRSTPKLNVLNTAIMTALHPNSFEHARKDGAFWGRLSESAVGAHLHNTLPHDRIIRLRYWRDGAREVDFVLASGRQLVAIEVKSGRRRGRVAGLDAFAARFPDVRKLVVGTGGVPLNEFLSEPAEFWVEEAYRAG
ncbi:MAG: ATP-binding protein [Gemmatimonadota bacterium]|nr:ATP-binding protein [Gemmatimonadota bacterium]